MQLFDYITATTKHKLHNQLCEHILPLATTIHIHHRRVISSIELQMVENFGLV